VATAHQVDRDEFGEDETCRGAQLPLVLLLLRLRFVFAAAQSK
jgi:hypothetical protein